MLGGMFKRKDKRGKGQDKDDEGEKTIVDSPRSPTPKESMESLSQEKQTSPATSQPHRQTSKLQKQPPAKLTSKPSYPGQNQATVPRQVPAEKLNSAAPESDRAPLSPAESNGSMRLVLPESRPLFDEKNSQYKTSDSAQEEAAGPVSPKEKGGNVFGPFVNALKSAPAESKPVKAKRSKNRMQMDDFDPTSSSEEQAIESPSTHKFHEGLGREADQHLPTAQQDPLPTSAPPQHSLSSSESLSPTPNHISPPTQQERSTPHQPPPLSTGSSSESQRDSSVSPISPSSSPELIEAPYNSTTAPETDPITTTAQTRAQAQETPSVSPATQPSANTPSTTRTTPTWSDASLRAFLEDDSEIRDLLIVVNDKTDVKPRKDHPVVQSLFREENQKLGEIERRLDELLGNFLGRKGRGGVR